MRRRRVGARCRAAAGEDNDGLDGSGLPHGVSEVKAILGRLHVGTHHLGGIVMREVADHVGERQVGLVADAGETGQALPGALEEQCDLQGEIAALRGKRQIAGREGPAVDVELTEIVVEAEAVGAEQHRAGRPHLLHQRFLYDEALGAGLAEPGGDDHERLGAERERLRDGIGDAGCRHDDHREIDGRSDVGDRRVNGEPVELATAQAHEVRVAEVLMIAKRLGHPPAPLQRVGRRPDEQHALRLEQRREVAALDQRSSWGSMARVAATPRLTRALARMTRWISEVPSQIRSTRSSRSRRSALLRRM